MSWSVSGTATQANVNETFKALREQALQQNPECGDQFDAVSEAAAALIQTGALGHGDKSFHVSLSGHANPDHEPRDGWANDSATIQMRQK